MYDVEIVRRYIAGEPTKAITYRSKLYGALKRRGIRVNRRLAVLGTEREQELVRRYLAGEPVKSIGNGRTLHLALQRNGVPRTRRLKAAAATLLVCCGAAAFLPSSAGAQSYPAGSPAPTISLCTDAAELRKAAWAKYGELEAGIGVTADGQLVQLLLDPNDASWTIIRLIGGGKACLVAAGEAWEFASIGDPL